MNNFIRQIVSLILIVLSPATAMLGQSVRKGNLITSPFLLTPGINFAQLPINFVNAGLTTGTGFCSPPGGTFDATKTMPGDYPATFTGMKQAKTDQVAANEWWKLVVTAGTNVHGSTYDGNTALMTWPTSGSVTKCLVIQSSAHNSDNQIVCFGERPGFGGPASPAAIASAKNCSWSGKNDAANFWKFTLDAIGGTYGMLFPQGPSYILVEDMEAAPAPGTNQSSPTAGAQLQVACVLCSFAGVALSWIHGYDPGDPGQPAGVCTSNGSWNRSGQVTTNGTAVTFSNTAHSTTTHKDRFGMDFTDALGTNAPGFPITTTGGNAMIINGVHYAIAIHDPAASSTTLTLATSAGVQATPVDYILTNPATIYANGCGDDSRGVQLNGSNVFFEFNSIGKIHEWGGESHAISIGFAPGPILIAKNAVEAGSAALFSGGGDTQLRGGPMQDIESGDNYYWRDLRWRALTCGAKSPVPPFGCGAIDGLSNHDTGAFLWAVKTLIEFKTANRVWSHGDMFDGDWPDGQSGHLFSLSTRTGSGDLFGAYDPVTGLPAEFLSNVRVDNCWLRNASQGIGIEPRSLGFGNGNGMAQFGNSYEFVNCFMTNISDTKQWGNPGDELIGASNNGQIYISTLSRTGGVAHAVVSPVKVTNYNSGTVGVYPNTFSVSSITSVSDVVTIHFNKQRVDPTVGGSFTLANGTGWNGTFTITGVQINTGGISYGTPQCTTDAYGNASAPFSQPQPCLRYVSGSPDGTYADTIIYADSINHPGTASLCTTLTLCNGLNLQATLDTHAYQISDISVGDGVYVHNCTGGSLGTPALFEVGATSFIPAIAPTNPAGVDVYYANIGGNDSGVTCNVENASGGPARILFTRNAVLSSGALATNSDSVSAQIYKNSYTHNTFATTGTAVINTCTHIAAEGTASFACWDIATFQFSDNVLVGRAAAKWSVVPIGSSVNFTSPNPSAVPCSGATATAGCLGLAGFMNGAPFPTTPCAYDGSNVFNCPLMAAPWSGNLNVASITPVGSSSYIPEYVDMGQFNAAMTATRGICPVGYYCGITGPYPY